MKGQAVCSLVLLSLALLPSAAAAGEPPGPAVATVDGTPITLEQFRSELERRSALAPGVFADPERRLALLDEMVRFEVLLASARKAGYDADPEIVRAFERWMVGKFRQDHIDALLEDLTVTDQEIERHYREHISDYTTPERVRVALIFLEMPDEATPEQRAALERKAEQALAEARALDPAKRTFGPVARRYSDDRVSRYLGGNIGWIARGQRDSRWEPAALEAMFALGEPGEIGPIAHGERGLYLVKLIEKEASAARPLAQLQPAIRDELVRERRKAAERDLYAQLESQTDVRIDRALVEAIEPPGNAEGDRDTRPPALPQP